MQQATIRIMPCLDMQNGRVVKGVHFVNIRDAGDPVACAQAYCEAGADELALLDITATVENRPTMLEVIRRVAEVTTVPFTVGGGISDVRSAAAVLEAGADKISVSSAAFRRPELIGQLLDEFGPQRVTVAIDVDQNPRCLLAMRCILTAVGQPPAWMPWSGPNGWTATACKSFCPPAKRPTGPRPDTISR